MGLNKTFFFFFFNYFFSSIWNSRNCFWSLLKSTNITFHHV